ncbi:hypothetical protein OUZ56_014961 [Daphnia magna]|uniref:Uncharacterized protein n=1 Tax=Daphnia magna TaxID=35525 RepID=A0ABR0ALE4_9CRUS|nr:hypothetical protein OUZ56_014961 [Daphnia magna]
MSAISYVDISSIPCLHSVSSLCSQVNKKDSPGSRLIVAFALAIVLSPSSPLPWPSSHRRLRLWPSSHRRLRLCLGHRLIAVFAFALAIVSSPSSPLPWPSSHRRLRLCLGHRLIAVFAHRLIAIFAFAISSVSSPSSPLPSPSSHRRLRFCLLHPLIAVFAIAAVFAFTFAIALSPSSHSPFTEKSIEKGCSLADSPRRWKEFIVDRRLACRDRALFCPMAMGGTVAAPLGAIGNAPVGTSLCRRGDRFPGVCIPGMVSITVPARTCLRTSPILFAILLT